MRTILSHRSIEKYLQKCATENSFSYGLVIGQPTQHNKDYIVHLAKYTDLYDESEHDVELQKQPESDEDSVSNSKAMESLDVSNLSHQAMCAVKMTPGCFYILGIFIVSDDDDIYENKESREKIKYLVEEINRIFVTNPYLCGNSKILGNEKLIMFFNSNTQKTDCRYYDCKTKTDFVSAEHVFLDKQIDLALFETNYELDEIFPLIENNKKLNIESHFNSTLEKMKVCIKNSKIFVHDEPVDDGIVLESYFKKSQNKHDKTKSLPVSILLTSKAAVDEPIEIKEYNGVIRYSGIITSRVWAHSKSTFKEIYDYIRADILRSMASRVQVYCDGLIDENASDDAVVINEPPRRVFFNKPDANGIQFCNYIFRGEFPSVVTSAVKLFLDLEIQGDDIDDSVEGSADDENFGLTNTPAPLNQQTKRKARGNSQLIYIAGIATAIFVLLVSIILHFVLR